MKTIAEIMKEEHNNILPVVDALEEKANELIDTREIDAAFFLKFIEFQRGYTDGIHHAKEEDILFPVLAEHEATKNNPDIKLLIHQHILSRAHMENIEEAIDQNKDQVIAKNALEYGSMIRDHIDREDSRLFPLVEQLLPDNTKNEVLRKFKKSEDEFPNGTLEKLLNLAQELTESC